MQLLTLGTAAVLLHMCYYVHSLSLSCGIMQQSSESLYPLQAVLLWRQSVYYVICIATAVAVWLCIALPLHGRNAQFSIASNIKFQMVWPSFAQLMSLYTTILMY